MECPILGGGGCPDAGPLQVPGRDAWLQRVDALLCRGWQPAVSLLGSCSRDVQELTVSCRRQAELLGGPGEKYMGGKKGQADVHPSLRNAV